MNWAVRIGVGISAALLVSSLAPGAIAVSQLGTGAPPATLGGMGVVPAISDPAPVFADVVSAPLTGTKSVLFSAPLSHRRIGSGWGSWSHGYMSDVYYTNGASSLTLTFNQTGMLAFYFYVEPNGFGLHDFTVSGTGSGGASASTTATIEGLSGAQGFGFSTTGGTTLTSMTITLTSGASGFLDFAVGEFGWWARPPAPGGLGVLAAAALCGRRRRR